MEVQIFLLSTMSGAMTAAYLKASGITFDGTAETTVQRARWKRPSGCASVSLWIACQHPVVDALAAELVPYMDASICLWHDHDALSCVRVRNAMNTLERFTREIWLQSTDRPRVTIQHKSRIRKFYTAHGFERPHRMGCLSETIEDILKVDLNIFKVSLAAGESLR